VEEYEDFIREIDEELTWALPKDAERADDDDAPPG
jgi:hypothetical protein